MTTGIDLPHVDGGTLYDAASIGAIVAFWLSLIAIIPGVMSRPGVAPRVIAFAAGLSVAAYLGLRWGVGRLDHT